MVMLPRYQGSYVSPEACIVLTQCIANSTIKVGLNQCHTWPRKLHRCREKREVVSVVELLTILHVRPFNVVHLC